MPDSLYDEPAYYRALFQERAADVAFYRAACAGAESVLELGAGEGRVSLALAADGARVVAVEQAVAMLAGLEARRAEAPAEVAARVEPVRADATTLRLEARFGRVILPFNVIAHFHDDAALGALLAVARAHLAPGGRVALDSLTPDDGLRDGAAAVPRLVHPRTGAVCRLEERYTWDAASAVLTVETVLVERETGARQSLTLRIRQRTEAEVADALAEAGLRVIERASLGDAVAFVAEAR